MKFNFIMSYALVIMLIITAFLYMNLFDQVQNAVPSANSSLYPMSATVSEVKGNVVTVTNFNGIKYQFFGAEDWAVGDICAAIMNDNGTESVYDDKISAVRYCGWVY